MRILLELDDALERIVDKKKESTYRRRDDVREDVAEEFSKWLVDKFMKETALK